MSVERCDQRYTPGQAAAKKSLIAVDLAEIEDHARHMACVVGGVDVDVDAALAGLREAGHQLNVVIDRRTRP